LHTFFGEQENGGSKRKEEEEVLGKNLGKMGKWGRNGKSDF
jgi:hypothetical protein